MLNKRKYERLKVSATITLCKKGLFRKGVPIRIHITNISKGGAQVISAVPFNKNDRVMLTCQSRDKLTSIDLAGKIAWTKPVTIKNTPLILVGIQFSSARDKDFEQVATMLIANLT